MAIESKPSSARLFGYIAREAPVGVLLRRGPSDWVQLILWHTDTDTFEYGQWFHGRIYEDVCDLSPDGSTFLYFAAKHQNKNWKDPHSLYAWTVMSRPPFLTALAFWPIYDDSYRGGGHFLDSHTVYLYADATEHPGKGTVPDDLKVITRTSAEARLQEKDTVHGWTELQKFKWEVGSCVQFQIMQKKKEGARYSLLRKWCPQERPNYFLLDNVTSSEISLHDTSWVDWDQRERLVLATDGKLFAVDRKKDINDSYEIADFNSQEFEEVIAPDWALKW